MDLNLDNLKICVIGLGYVGLPLARLFSTKYPTMGYDLNKARVDAINSGHDDTMEVSGDLLRAAIDSHRLRCTTELDDIRECNFYIVAVPTPIDRNYRPDLQPLIKASETIGKIIKKGDIVVYESTVYPGMTEEVCVPVIEKTCGYRLNEYFYAGYSPERINPGDRSHTVEKIKKVTSGSTPEIAEFIDKVYDSVLENGTYMAPSIKVAEASKIIENTQRDINIAFMNELAMIFNAMDIDIHDVLEAASTKWNFIRLTPGLVGGHCIAVDPYYLIQKANTYGVTPSVISAARSINEGMGNYVATQTIKAMNRKGILVKDAKILILGVTFKENCSDTRNTKIPTICQALEEYTSRITVYDPWADPERVMDEFGIEIKTDNLHELRGRFDAVILAVAHKDFSDINVRDFLSDPINGVVFDVKGTLPREMADARI